MYIVPNSLQISFAIKSRKVKVATKWRNFLLYETGPILNHIENLITLHNLLSQPDVTNDLLMVC